MKVRVNPSVFRYHVERAGKTITAIGGDSNSARVLFNILTGRTRFTTMKMIRKFAENMGIEPRELIPDKKIDKIIRVFAEVE